MLIKKENLYKNPFMQGEGRSLFIGLTGGIASGKSTVAGMLADLGVAHIDYDVLARQAVEPGKPAWKDILDYFGRHVLNEDDSINRKRLGEIIFQDSQKRKKLERFTHPRIHDLFVEQLGKIIKRNPESIIQVSVPLMIEQNLQHMFHKLVVVYVPEQTQLERLMSRDKMSRDQACTIIEAQLSIEEKVGYADFIINNDGSEGETRKQVQDMWKELKQLQIEMAEEPEVNR